MKRQWQNTRNESKIIMVTRLIFKAHTMAQVDSVSVITTPLWLQPFYSPTHSLFGQKRNHISCEYNSHLSIFPIEVCHYTLKHYLSCAHLGCRSFTLIFIIFFFISMFDCWIRHSDFIGKHNYWSVYNWLFFSVRSDQMGKKDLNRLLNLFYLLIENIHNNSITSNNLMQLFFVWLSL